MAKCLPERIFPLRLGYLGQRLVGTIRLEKMSRLNGDYGQGDLQRGNGDVRVELYFEHPGDSPPRAIGTVGVCLRFQCQRCLEPVDIDVATDVNLALIRRGGLDRPKDDEDYLEIDDDAVDLAALVEDELILALPIIALHPEGDCQAVGPGPAVGEEVIEGPFAVLATLKNR